MRRKKSQQQKLSRLDFLKGLGATGILLVAGGSGVAQIFRKKASATPQRSEFEQSFTYVIYKVNPNDPNSETIARKYRGGKYSDGGTNPIHDLNAEIIFQKVLDDPGPPGPSNEITGPGHIYVRDGIYKLHESFRGFDIKSYTTITLGPQAVIKVPNGYSGHVFRLEGIRGNSVSHIMIDGGVIAEADPPKRKWTAILLKGTDSGVFFNKIVNTTVFNAEIGIRLEAHTDPSNNTAGWVNGNSFEAMKMWLNKTFIDFHMVGPYTRGNPGIDRNNFTNLECQSANSRQKRPNEFTTVYGVRNIRHTGNMFIDVKIWDFPDIPPNPPEIPPDAKICNIAKDATDTIIVGGMMSGTSFTNKNRNFVDLGKSSKIL